MYRRWLSLIVVVGMLAGLFSPFAPAAIRPQPVLAADIVIDGVREAAWGNPVATDPLGDMTEANLDLHRLYMAEDEDNFYIGFDAYASTWGMTYGIYIDTDQIDGSGATSDPWGRAVAAVPAHLPEYALYVWHNDNNTLGEAQFTTWTGTAWEYPTLISVGGEQAFGSAHNWIEYAIPKAALGDPAQIAVIVFTTGGNGHAQDTVPSDPAVTYTDPEWGGDTTTLSAFYVFPPVLIDGERDAGWGDPVAIDPLGDMTEPNLDLHRLYMVEDADNFYIGFDAYVSDWGMSYGIYIDTDQIIGSGADEDVWGRNVAAVAEHLPEYTLYVWHANGELEDAELATWVDSEWSYPSPTLVDVGGAQAFNSDNNWIEYRIPKAALGYPEKIAVIVFTTGGGGHAQDTVPSDPAVAYTVPEWGTDVTTLSAFYVFSQSSLKLQLTAPTEGAFFSSPDINVIGTVIPATGVTVTVDLNGADVYTPTLDAEGNFNQAVTLASGANVITVQATDGVDVVYAVRHVNQGAAQDNTIFWDGLGHNSRDDLYRTPTGAVTLGTEVKLRLRAFSGDLTGARVRLWEDRNNVQMLLNMQKVADDGVYEWWEATLDTGMDPTIYWYRFIAMDGTAIAYYEDDSARTGGWGRAFATVQDNGWQLTVYNPAFDSPDWVKNGVIYQIFPERFRDGDPTNNNEAGEFHYDIPGGSIVRSTGTDWNTPLCDPRDEAGDCPMIWGQNFYGGDLQGIIDQMDYLDDLGVTILYLNPIFESPSNHKYDTTDFGVIDDNFGDLDTFLALIAAADARGMKIVLDGVFNHASSDSIYFDRYGRYDSVGACESIASPYRDWYYFEDVAPGAGICVGSDGTPNAAVYESWWGYDSLPRMRSTHPEVRELIWEGGADSIAPYWINHGAAGWRFDVAADVDPGATNDPTNDYWEGFRDVVRAIDPGSYMVGEEWGNSTPWLLEPEWDASMNYQFGSALMSFWRSTPFTDNDFNSGSSAGPLNPITPSELEERLRYLQERYPSEAFYAMMNLLGSHDTNRALFLLDHNADQNDPALYQNPLYDWSDAITRLKGVALLQLTMPGAPTIYYGDEVGLVGPVAYAGDKWEDDPYNRLPFPWLDETGAPFYTHLQTQTGQDALRDYYKLLIATRKAHPALRTGDFETLLTDDDAMLYAYGRQTYTFPDAAIVLANRDDVAQDATLDVGGYIAAGATFVDVLNGDTVYTVDSAGQINVTGVPAMSGALLVLSGTLPMPPGSVFYVNIAEGDGELELSWAALGSADSYDIYRSLVSGGGYEFVANTTSAIYTDTGLLNARNYYYVVYSRDDTTLLTGQASYESVGMPHASIDWANLQWPEEITHTVGITPTENIYGQVYIDGVTSEPGVTPGLSAQLGYGPVADAPADWTRWIDAGFNGNSGNNDEFVAQLLPETAGEYYYLYRYSTTAGREWVYADRSGIIEATAVVTPGLLHVLAAADTTPPSVPQNLEVTGWSAGHIALAWDAGSDADLYAYELYRYGEGETALDAVKVARILAPATTYSDESVVTGRTYTYTVAALDENFNESAFSNEASATAEARLVQVVFNVTIPDFTPADAVIYIAGDSAEAFGASWNPGAQPITKLSATQWVYTATISDGAALLYKYTRGNWDVVENWGPITGFANRMLTVEYGSTGEMVVNNVVHNWRDPLVIEHYPAAAATVWDVDAPLTVRFNRSLNTTLINTTTFALQGLASGPVDGDFDFAPHVDYAVDALYGAINITGTLVTFTPTTALTLDDSYMVTLNAAGFVDEGPMRRDYSWTFGALPELNISKSVYPTTDVNPETAVVTYTIIISNTGDADAYDVMLYDMLPSQMFVSAWVEYPGETEPPVNTRLISWTGVISSGETATFIFVADFYAESVFPITNALTNVATYEHISGGGQDEATFTIFTAKVIYLPLVMRLAP